MVSCRLLVKASIVILSILCSSCSVVILARCIVVNDIIAATIAMKSSLAGAMWVSTTIIAGRAHSTAMFLVAL